MSILETSASDLENGVLVLPAVGADGVLRILVTNHKYRLERTTTLTITLPASVTSPFLNHYVIDADHSNYYDQGSGTGALEATADLTVTDGTVSLTMQPRSVHLLTQPTARSLPKDRRSKGGSKPHGRIH